jgi:HlyD family secretion protein
MQPRCSDTLRGNAAVLLAAVWMTSCGSSPKLGSPPADVTVQVTKAENRAISQIVSVGGVVFPLHQASLSPKITAPVKTFYIKRGDHVHRGQLLAVLENKDLAAAAVSASGTLDTAKATYTTTTATGIPEQLQTAKLNLRNADANLKAQQKLYDSHLWLYEQHAIARKQVDQSQVALTAATSQYETASKYLNDLEKLGQAEQKNAAKGQLESARGQYLAAQAQLGYSELRSPIDGVVAERPLYPGDIATAGTALITIVDVSKVIVRLHVAQAQAALLKPGDSATIEVPGLKTAVTGKITVFSPTLDPNSTTLELWVEAASPANQLEPGTSVQVNLIAKVVSNAVVVPLSSILTAADGTTSVMVVNSNSRVSRKKVSTGIEENGNVQILSGLNAGEQIVATGAYGLPDNVKVTPKSGPAAVSNNGPGTRK